MRRSSDDDMRDGRKITEFVHTNYPRIERGYTLISNTGVTKRKLGLLRLTVEKVKINRP
jgi:hypothetical protein